MESKKQNAKGDHVVIVTSEAEGASVKKYKIKRSVITALTIVVCILIGAFLGYIIYEERIWATANGKIDAYKDIVADMEAQLADEKAATEAAVAEQANIKKEYENEIAVLNEKLTIMSDTVHQKVKEVEELTAVVDSYSNPTLLPLTGAATIEMAEGLEPMCIFHASDGALVVATAGGIVTELVEDAEYGYRMVVDHGNGYMTIYQNQGEPKVKAGDEIRQGVTLFIIEATNTKLAYQVVKDGVYVNPMDVMQISG